MTDKQSSVLRLAALFSAMMQRTGPRSLSLSVAPLRVGVAAGSAPVVLAERGTESDDQERNDAAEPEKTNNKDPQSQTVVRSVGEQLSIGGVLGFATGYSIRKIGRAVMFVVGTEVVILQYMAYRQWLVMDWRKLANDISPKFSRGAWEGALEILLYKMPFNVAFTGGLMAGLRLSAAK